MAIGSPALAHPPALVEQTEQAGLPVWLSIEGQPRPLPIPVEVHAYRIVQQALTNSLKHAGPASADVLVRHRPGRQAAHHRQPALNGGRAT